MENFQKTLLRMKQELGVSRDQEAAELLGMTKSAFSERKKRDSFPDDKLQALIGRRPELGLDYDYITTGVRKAEFDRVAESTMPAHMKPGPEGAEAKLLRYWRFLPPELQQQIQDHTETLAMLVMQAKGK